MKLTKQLAFVSNLSYSDIRKRQERSINAAASSFFFYTQKLKYFVKSQNFCIPEPGIHHEKEI